MKLEHPLIGMVIRKCVFLNCANKDIMFCWVPSHVDIRGSKKADIWQDDWNGTVTNKLHSVKPVLGDWQSSYRRCRKDDVVLCRAHIGHTYLAHSYILNKDPPPQCDHCQCILTVRHILVECNHLAQTRNDVFGRCGVVESLQFHPELVFKNLRDSDFYLNF